MNFKSIQKQYLDSITESLHSQNHIDSFNYFIEKGLQKMAKEINSIKIKGDPNKSQIYESLEFGFENLTAGSPNQLPYECRLTNSSYTVPLFATLTIIIDKTEKYTKNFSLGEIPIMVLSKKCLLYNKKKNLTAFNEDEKEVGGYFIINGLEKILRNIIIPRKNYPMGLIRGTFQQRKKNFTQFAVTIKSSSTIYKNQSLTIHYTSEENIYMSIMIKKVEYLFPLSVIIKALGDISDFTFVNLIEVPGSNFNPVNLIKDLHDRNLRNQGQCLRYLGFLMKNILRMSCEDYSEEDIGRSFLDNYVLIHLRDNWDKVKLFSFMIQKLLKLKNEELEPENLDSLCMQEILTSGQLYGCFFREKLEEVLESVKFRFQKDLAKESDLGVTERIEKAFDQSTKIGKKIITLLATGNLKSPSGLDLMQNTGYSIIAERLNNMRFWSHLRSVHRGAYFVEMKTTKVRKLLSENWGFLCPVHTPDGGLCGLLNHLSLGCILQNEPLELEEKDYNLLQTVMVEYGMLYDPNSNFNQKDYLKVILDGLILGTIDEESSEEFVKKLRNLLKNPKNKKYSKFQKISLTLIKDNPNHKIKKQYPGIYLSLSEGRPIRKVYNIKNSFTEQIDPFEQSYMMISTNMSELTTQHTHIEIQQDSLLSELAAQIPYMVHNQSPRDMYQCQMAKQTMGTATMCLSKRSDNKMYSLNTPQIPLITSVTCDRLGFNDFPSGVNSVIAVLSYTGYDIEDAMIINKSAYERGFMHGGVHKSFVMDMADKSGGKNVSKVLFNHLDGYREEFERLGEEVDERRVCINELLKGVQGKKKTEIDGLPKVGDTLSNGDVKIGYFDEETGEKKFKYYKDIEKSHIESIYLTSKKENETKVGLTLKLRYNRNPVVGDKFSSRHGQKGVLGVLWPQTNMPFSENGITPDIIINPNAFPSRMTIGMLIEVLASKTQSLEGRRITDGKAFEREDFHKIGKRLEKFGYNKLGTEMLYSGVYGIPLKAEIYQGIVYYQRLRHMIKDKAQARSTGPIDVLTRQPIKGRKKGGGIRLGEMERDALIAHGVSYILKERLLNSSDSHEAFICDGCGNLLSSFEKDDPIFEKSYRVCVLCEKEKRNSEQKKVIIPYVLRYLVNELAAMNIKLNFSLK